MIFAKYLPHLYQGADHTGRRVLNSGGGGGGPSTSTTYTSNIPDWLRPQTEALLGAATQEYFNTEFDPDTGGYNITGTKPYTPYSADPRDYVAQFSPQQQQVFGEAARMQTPGGFYQGAGMTGAAGMGGLETVGGAYGYGGQGAMYGGQAAGMGGLYERMATDPMSMQAYMSPYMQNVVEIQKQQAIEDAQRAQLGANLGAARQGTYGGARQTLAQAQREAGLNKQLSDIQAQGLQSAFDQAQKAQQFGVTTGLQGLQTGISGAQTGLAGIQAAQQGYGLTGQMGAQAANIASQQQQADLARLGFQGQMGDIQQQQQQAIINQAIQDYALSQEMPMQRLAGYSGLLRGYATPTTTVSQYQAAPNALQTVGALGTAAGGFGSLMGAGKKAGGVIKYAGGGGITDINALEGMAEDLSISQLQKSMQNETLPKYVGMPILENKVNEAERMKMAQAMMGGQQQGGQSISDALMAKADQLQGITDIAQPVMAAGGGMVAFAGGDVVKGALNLTPDQLKNYIDTLRKKGTDPRVIEAVKKNPSLLSRVASKIPRLGIAGIAAVPGVYATDALMATDTGVGDEADVMFSGITPGSAGPRTARNALEAGQELIGGVGRDIFKALAPTGYEAAQAEREAQGAPAVSPTYPDEAQRGIKPGPTAATAAKPGAGKTKPEGGISTELDNILKGMEGTDQQGGMGQQQSLKDFADQYLRDRAAYAGEDVMAQKLKERAEKEASIYDRLSSAGAQIGLAGSMLRDPSKFGEYSQQAAGLRAAEAKAKDEREMDFIKAMDRERQNRITAFDKAEQRMSDKEKQSTQFKHEKALQADRLRVQAAGIKVQELSALATAANTRELKKASELRQYTEFFAEQPIKINRLFDDKLKALRDSNDYMSLKAEEQKKEVEAIEAARRLALNELDTLKQQTMYGGMKIVGVR